MQHDTTHTLWVGLLYTLGKFKSHLRKKTPASPVCGGVTFGKEPASVKSDRIKVGGKGSVAFCEAGEKADTKYLACRRDGSKTRNTEKHLMSFATFESEDFANSVVRKLNKVSLKIIFLEYELSL